MDLVIKSESSKQKVEEGTHLSQSQSGQILGSNLGF